MALERQVVSVLLNQGVDEKSDDKVTTKLLTAENVVFTRTGMVQKRNGYSVLRGETMVQGRSDGSAVGSGNALGNFDDELLMCSSGSLLTYSPVHDRWIPRGHVANTKLRTSTVVQNAYEQTHADRAETSGVALFAWLDNRGGIRARVQSTETDAVFQSDVLISQGVGDSLAREPRCVVIGSFLAVLYRIGQEIWCQRLNPLDPLAFLNAQLLVEDVSTTEPFWDVASMGSNAILAWNPQNDGGPESATIKFGYVTPAGTIGASGWGLPEPSSITDEATYGGLGLAVEPTTQDRFALAWYSDYSYSTGGDPVVIIQVQQLRGIMVSSSLAPITPILGLDSDDSLLSGSVISITAAFETTSSWRAYYEVRNPEQALYGTNTRHASADGTTVTSGSVLYRSVGLASQAFTYGTGSFVGLTYESTVQPTGFFVRGGDRKIVARTLPLRASGLVSGTIRPHVQALGGGGFALASSVRGALRDAVAEPRAPGVLPPSAASGSVYTLKGVGSTELSFDDAATGYAQGQLGRTLVFAGGIGSGYDGHRATEHGFAVFPEIVSIPQAPLTQSYRLYTALYRWIDDQGLVHRSAPSIPKPSVTSGSVTVQSLRVTEKPDVVVEVYRTEVNGTIFYRCGQAANDTGSDVVVVPDLTSDAVLIGNERLYTLGGVLPSFPPDPSSVVCIGKNRCFIAGLEDDPNTVRYTRHRTEGEGLAFHPDLEIVVDPYGGPITAMAAMDEALVIFKQEAIFVVAGDGPDDSGLNDQFTAPRLVSTDVGCVDARSVVLTPDGLMFKSSKGIYLLDRSLQALYVGAPVEGHNGDEVVAATLVQDKNQVRFLLSSGEALVYDYLVRQWSTFTNHRFATDATNWDGTYVYLRSDGEVRRETDGVHLDAGASVPFRIETGNIHLAGLQGFQRVSRARFLGEFKSPHVIRVEAAFNYSDTWIPQGSWDPTGSLAFTYYGSGSYGEETPYGGSSDTVYQLERQMNPQKCEAVRFRLEDVGSYGESLTLTEIALDVGVKKGGNKMSTNRRI